MLLPQHECALLLTCELVLRHSQSFKAEWLLYYVSSFILMNTCILLTARIRVFRLILRTSSDYFSKGH